MGMTDNGAFIAPTTCTSSAGSCTISGSSAITPASPSPTASATASPSATATPAPTAVTPYTPKSGSYAGGKKIVGYYPAWATYARNYQVSDMAAGKLTHINYAFANIANGKCVLGDSYADTDKAFAGDSWDQGALRGNFNQLAKVKAANPGLKTMISIGGWTWSQNFSAAAASDESRKTFVSSCVDFMKQYKFDGIDIDWEYPVSGGLHGGTAADKQNYTALLQEFRAELDAQGAADGGKHYSLSIAAPAGPSIIPNLEVGKIAGSLDWMNLMSYDYHGGWDPITGHNAPMTVGTKDAAKGFSITDTVDTYINGGFPAAKLVLGVPFYGRGWENVSTTDAGLYQAGTSASVGTWEKGVFDYTDIRANYLPTMTRYWDTQAQVPYLYDPVRKLWISYDDPQSMRIKADFIKSRGLGGAMAWEMSGDRDQELLDTLVGNL
jgi:chitinase